MDPMGGWSNFNILTTEANPLVRPLLTACGHPGSPTLGTLAGQPFSRRDGLAPVADTFGFEDETLPCWRLGAHPRVDDDRCIAPLPLPPEQASCFSLAGFLCR